jgi:hypothetical protein
MKRAVVGDHVIVGVAKEIVRVTDCVPCAYALVAAAVAVTEQVPIAL